jgi:hypothetical protein
VLPERYRDDAARIVKGLAVLKLLEHGAINGATAQELANTLFIIPPGKLMVDPTWRGIMWSAFSKISAK